MTDSELNLDPTVDWIPMKQASEILGVHPSQVRRDRSILEELCLISYNFRSNGFTREAFEMLWQFRKLVKERGRRHAIAKIVIVGDGND